MLGLTLKQLEAFYWAATCSNFATAAERLHLSVSSLSKRLTELEQVLGQQVFDRSGHKAVLTDAGSRLLPAATAVLESVSSLERTLARHGGLSGNCRFGVGELSALTWLPRFVARLCADHPDLDVQPSVDVGAVLARRVEHGELDFAVIAGPSARPGLLSRAVGAARFQWMASPVLLPDIREMAPSLLQRHPLVTLPRGAGTTRILDDWLLARGMTVRRRLECNSWAAIAGMLREGVGIGFLPEGWSNSASVSPSLQVLRSAPALAPLQYSLQWRRDDSRPLLQAAADILADCVDFTVLSGLP